MKSIIPEKSGKVIALIDNEKWVRIDIMMACSIFFWGYNGESRCYPFTATTWPFKEWYYEGTL